MLYSFLVSPYLDNLKSIRDQTTKAHDDLASGKLLIARQKRLQPVWQDMIKGGLHSDDSQSQNTAERAFSQWASYANITFDAVHADRALQMGQFQTMAFNVDFTVQQQDAVRPISQFLWAAETATVPMRVNKVIISSVKEGTNQLNVKVNLSTLFAPPTSGQDASPATPGQPVSSINF